MLAVKVDTSSHLGRQSSVAHDPSARHLVIGETGGQYLLRVTSHCMQHLFVPVACNRSAGASHPCTDARTGVHRVIETGVIETGEPFEDDATRALRRLLTELDACTAQLDQARARAEALLAARASGLPWIEVVNSEARPLIVERITTVLGTLSTAGHAWRRHQAAALQAEDVSINRIAAMFGVTRQRISALLKERGAPDPD
jgi:hypothetical protein